jgi:cytochrome P450
MTEPPVVPLPLRRETSRPFDPDEELGRLRAEREIAVQPLPDGRFAWLVTRHADVRAVLSDPRFSNARTHPGMLRPTDDGTDPAAQDQAPPTGSLIMTDPPEHTRLRRMLTGEFTVKRMNRLPPGTRRPPTC